MAKNSFYEGFGPVHLADKPMRNFIRGLPCPDGFTGYRQPPESDHRKQENDADDPNKEKAALSLQMAS